MPTNILPLVSYVLVSTFTPGPSNISSTSQAVLHSYKQTLPFQAGLALGVFIVMLLCGWISTTLFTLFPALEPLLRYAGAAYILYLAFVILKANYTFSDRAVKPFGFIHGLTLQILNPKLVVYAFTVFSAFLAALTNNLALLILAAFTLALISFLATSVWALFGTVIQAYLRHPRLKTIVNIVLALSLVYTAAAVVGIV